MIKLPLQLPYPEASTICDATGSSIAECRDNETAKKLIEAFGALAELIEEADSSAWHYSRDCKVEKRNDCELCAALKRARSALFISQDELEEDAS